MKKTGTFTTHLLLLSVITMKQKIMNKLNHTNSSDSSQDELLKDEELWFSSLAANKCHVYDADKAFRHFKERTGMQATGRRRYIWLYIVSAAAMLLLLFAAVILYQNKYNVSRQQVAKVVINAPLGSKLKVSLPDSSQVWLNSGSQLTYSKDFGIANRVLFFQGEAYFEVRKNNKLPFCIYTSDLNLTVLGTKFNFQNYRDDEMAVVDLLEGKVALDNKLKKMNRLYLVRNERMIFNKVNGKMKIISMSTKHSNSWINNLLFFKREPLLNITKRLERIYNKKIRIDNTSLKKEYFYGDFDCQKQSLYEILDILSETGRLRYKIKSDTIVIK